MPDLDLIKNLGEFALASRLRRLADKLSQDVTTIYKQEHIDFEPRWFTVYYALKTLGPMSVMDLAKALGVSHPAINQIACELIKADLVSSAKDDEDKRKRILTLTEQGEAVYEKLNPTWGAIDLAIRGLIADSGMDVISVIDRLERQLDEKPFARRIQGHLETLHQSAVEVLMYHPRYKADFERLNREWIEAYFTVEEEDITLFEQAEEKIITPGGEIFFARIDNQIVGTCALLKISDDHYELGKMAVSQSAQGKQIGSRLLQEAINFCRKKGASVLSLESNRKLHAAINLYRKFGFIEVPVGSLHPRGFDRVDIVMKLDLTPTLSGHAHGY